jgi:hypothetical protein
MWHCLERPSQFDLRALYARQRSKAPRGKLQCLATECRLVGEGHEALRSDAMRGG